MLSAINALAWAVLGAGIICGLPYAIEIVHAWLGGNKYELFTFYRLRFSSYGMSALCPMVAPHLIWFRSCRRNPWWMAAICAVILTPEVCQRMIADLSSLGVTP